MNILELDKKIYTTLKRLRLAKGLSQEALASIANKDRTYISGIERFERNISLKTLIELLCALEVDYETFIKELEKDD